MLDLCGRKILGSAAGNQKNAKLVETAFYTIQTDLRNIKLFHTDRGSEFKNKLIEDILDAFGIKRSPSAKGTPHDNSVAESMYNIIKTELVFEQKFADLDEKLDNNLSRAKSREKNWHYVTDGRISLRLLLTVKNMTAMTWIAL